MVDVGCGRARSRAEDRSDFHLDRMATNLRFEEVAWPTLKHPLTTAFGAETWIRRASMKRRKSSFLLQESMRVPNILPTGVPSPLHRTGVAFLKFGCARATVPM